MKPFSLEEYLKNPDREVVTRDGRKVRIICTDRKNHEDYPIIALVKTDKGEEIVNSYTIDGNWYGGGIKHKLDLFFAPEKHEGWINIFRGKDSPFTGNIIFASKEEAEESSRHCCGFTEGLYMTSAKVEWED